MKTKCILPPYLNLILTLSHGSTYAEALQNAQEVLEILIEGYQVKDKQLPQPALAS